MEALSLFHLQPQHQPRRRRLQLDCRSSQLQKPFLNNSGVISFSYRISSHSLSLSSSFRIRAQSSVHDSSIPGVGNIQNDSETPQTLKPFPLSILKLPLSVLVASAALLLSRFSLRPPPAFAEPPPATASPAAESISVDLDLSKEDIVQKEEADLKENDTNKNNSPPKEEADLTENENNKNDAAPKDAVDLKENNGNNNKNKTDAAVPIPKDERALEEYLTAHPYDAEALGSLLDFKINKQHYRAAIDIIPRLIKLQPEGELVFRVLRGHMYGYMGDFDKAKSEFKSVLEEHPIYVEALDGMLMWLAQSPGDIRKELRELMGRIEWGLGLCEGEEGMEIERRELRLLWAQITVMEGQYGVAMKMYRDLVDEEPDDFRPYLCQGMVFSMMNRKHDAERLFAEYRKRAPEDHPYTRDVEEDLKEFIRDGRGGGGAGRRDFRAGRERRRR